MELRAGEGIIRPWREDDAEELAVVANDRRVWLTVRDVFPHPYGIDDARRFLAFATGASPQTHFAIEVAGHVAGGIGFTLKQDVERVGAELGLWLGVAYWGRGIATAAVTAMTRYIFATRPELQRIWAMTFATNPASMRVLEKAGFTLEGVLRDSVIKDGQVLDARVYARLRREALAAGATGERTTEDTE